MDGNTTLITRAGDMAVARGIVVVNSAGNAGAADSTHNTLLAPADGDSVITVGAVDSLGVRVTFSSIGPTADGRTKPDVMARGRRTYAAFPDSTTAYNIASGTSLSCPLVAGVAALLVAAHPAATPMQIRDAMRNTASQAGSPDNFMGWGIIDALAAHAYLTSTDAPRLGALPAFRLVPIAPNPFNPGAVIRYDLPVRSDVVLRIYDVRGRLVRTLVAGPQPADTHAVTWNGASDRGLDVASGTYFVQLRASSLATGSMPFRATQKVTLVR
jgi:subtilisin family serine protease